MLKRADPAFAEEAILMRALRDFNTPKIPSNDIPIFLRLISDLFPGLDLAPKLNENLHKVLSESNTSSKVSFNRMNLLLDVRGDY